MTVTIKTKLVEEAKTKKVAKLTDWKNVKEYYFKESFRRLPKPYTLLQLSKHFNLSYGTVRNRSSKYDWDIQLREYIEKHYEEERKNIEERDKKAVSKLKEEEVNTEVATRKRHVEIARLMQDKARMRLERLSPYAINVTDAIKLLQVGLSEERKALGIADVLQVNHNVQNEEEITFRKSHKIIDHIIEVVQNEDGVFELDDGPENIPE